MSTGSLVKSRRPAANANRGEKRLYQEWRFFQGAAAFGCRLSRRTAAEGSRSLRFSDSAKIQGKWEIRSDWRLFGDKGSRAVAVTEEAC